MRTCGFLARAAPIYFLNSVGTVVMSGAKLAVKNSILLPKGADLGMGEKPSPDDAISKKVANSEKKISVGEPIVRLV